MKSLRSYLFVPVVLALMGLAACGDSDDSDKAAEDVASTVVEASTTAPPTTDAESSETTAPEETTPPTEATTAPTKAPATTEAPAPAASPLADFEEYAVLQSTIDDLDSLTPEIETDNPNTRVILYANPDGRKVYKSIFVKRSNRLKIINIDGGGPPLYNDPI